MKSIDFTNLPQKNKSYSGANGSKLCIIYNNEDYMLKFPASSTKNDDISYTNACVSEYIGCHTFESVGIDVKYIEEQLKEKKNISKKTVYKSISDDDEMSISD